jgi:acetyl esterase/lipase
MNRLLTAQAFILLTLGLLAHGEDARPNSPDIRTPAAVAGGIREVRDVPYVTAGHERQRLDIFLPPKSTTLRPVVVWIHGGAWQSGSKANCPAKPLVGKGYVVVSLGYRLSQSAIFPAQIEDCKAAIRWLRAHAGEYGIDPNHIGVWGASAGGQLAALLGTTGENHDFDVGENLNQSSAVQCVIDWFGPTDFLHYGAVDRKLEEDPNGVYAKFIGGIPSEKPEQVKRSSPITYVQPGVAPFLIMQGDQDTVVPAQQSEVLHAALRKAGVESTLKIFPGAGHGGPDFSTPASVQQMSDFLDRHLQSAAGS